MNDKNDCDFFSHTLQDEISSRESNEKKTLKKKAKIYFRSLYFEPNFILVPILILCLPQSLKIENHFHFGPCH